MEYAMKTSECKHNVTTQFEAQSRRLLYIDDNPLVLETVKQLLSKTDYHLLISDDPFKGLCCLVKNKPPTLFIDANMGKINGFQFCALIRAQKQFQYLSVIIVLEFSNIIEQAKARAAGDSTVLIKPFGRAELVALCEKTGIRAA